MTAKRTILTGIFLLVIVLGLFPILAMIAASLHADGRWTFDSYQGLLTSRREWALLRHSFVLAASVSLLTALFGVPLGILFGKTDFPMRRFFTIAFTVPLMIPPYITAIGWADFLGANGLFAKLCGEAAAGAAYNLLFGFTGCLFVLFSTFLPVVILLTMTSLKSVHPRLEDAGRLVTGWPGVLRRITVPLILPSILFGIILVFLLTIGEFGVPNFLRYDVFVLESFVQFSAFYNFGAATAAVLPLALFTVLALLIEWVFLRERFHEVQTVPEKAASPVIELGGCRTGSFVWTAVFCLTVVALPLTVLVGRSFSVSVYASALAVASDSLLRSLVYAVLGASLLSLVGFFMGYLVGRQALPFWRTADTLTIFLFALPSAVIGIGLISLWNRPLTNFIYGSSTMIIIGYLVKYAALTSRITASTLSMIPQSMEDAGELAGLGWMRRIGWIVAPMARKGLLGGWLVGYVFCLRDLETTMIIYPPGHETLPVRIMTLMANSPPERIAALCVVMACATVVPPALAWSLVSLKRGGRNHETH